MSVCRLMGIETEYGILAPELPGADPGWLSSLVVGAHTVRANATGEPWACWNAGAGLLAGVEVSRATRPHVPVDGSFASFDSATDGVQRDALVTNVALANGGRLYVDHAHPEYSSPEVVGPRAALQWDLAGEQIVAAAAQAVNTEAGGPEIVVYKNNVDGLGASYGCHENYLVDRAVPFDTLAACLIPFLATRQVFTGSGRVGLGEFSEHPGFQLSQRADYLVTETGLATTRRRSIVNTRDEPHADRSRWRRLHLICGDANLFEVATFLKLGTTALVLWVIERLDALAVAGVNASAELRALRLAEPVAAVREVSRDLDVNQPLSLANGRRLTALEIQHLYRDLVIRSLTALGSTSRIGGEPQTDIETAEVLARWGAVLHGLQSDFVSLAGQVEWVAKLRLLQGFRDRYDLEWDNPRLRALDLQWTDLRGEKSIYRRLLASGAVERLIDDDAVAAAVTDPPQNTRAATRAQAVRRFGQELIADWDSLALPDRLIPLLDV